MACDALMRILDMECHEIEGGVAICLPVVLLEGAPVYAYLREESGRVRITDEGDVRMSADALGIGLRRRFDVGLESRIEQATEGLPVAAKLEGGVIVAEGPTAMASFVMDAFLRAVIAADGYIRERAIIDQKHDELVAAIEDAARRWFGGEVVRHARVRGASGMEHVFDVRAGNHLFAATRPNGRSTGPALRRVLDVRKLDDSLIVTIVVDDSESPEAARSEASIISEVAPVLFRSNLKSEHPPMNIAA